ncbi:twin transmembrane helix small protein [Neptunicoccus cionae]|uniref:twin transmembrane helix small protein n=1 Tax=Neptunicoccus cionae TaxID=2035344 RepID=UPI000C75A485|nr:twin transmembrane helix small protein [Amylibacter cionae]MBR9863252.1 twin transmembrane helix small protein [Paracoccaceae bacterium]PLS19994.1 twin transmembrane helix small protein [Amylibacter cionae]
MTVFYYIVIFAILAVFIVLMIGLGSFTSGGDFNRKYGNKLMRYRIIAQAIAIILILLFVILRGTGG